MTFWELFFPVSRDISICAFMGVTVQLLNGKKRPRARMISLVVGNYLTAVYLTELVAELSDITHLGGIAFAIGVGGFSLIDRLIEKVFNRITDIKIPDENGTVNDSVE